MGGGLRPLAPVWVVAWETEILASAIVVSPVVRRVGEPGWALWAVAVAPAIGLDPGKSAGRGNGLPNTHPG